jgi:hypothetical protein
MPGLVDRSLSIQKVDHHTAWRYLAGLALENCVKNSSDRPKWQRNDVANYIEEPAVLRVGI